MKLPMNLWIYAQMLQTYGPTKLGTEMQVHLNLQISEFLLSISFLVSMFCSCFCYVSWQHQGYVAGVPLECRKLTLKLTVWKVLRGIASLSSAPVGSSKAPLTWWFEWLWHQETKICGRGCCTWTLGTKPCCSFHRGSLASLSPPFPRLHRCTATHCSRTSSTRFGCVGWLKLLRDGP